MDQPVSIDLEVIGEEEEAKKAVLVANERLDQGSFGFSITKYVYQKDADFTEQLKDIYDVLGEFEWKEKENNIFEFKAWQESYSCTDRDGIEDVAERMILAGPGIEFRMTVSGIEPDDGEGELCADIEYSHGNLKKDFREGGFFDDIGWE